MTDRPEPLEYPGVPQSGPPPAGQAPYPYSYPPGPPGPAGYQPGPYPGGYPPPPMPYGDYHPGVPMPPRNGLGVAALVLAVIALVASCSVAGGLVLGIAAIVVGVLARGRVNRGEANNGGVATTGIILGAVAVVISLAFIALYSRVFNEYGGGDLVSCVQDAGGDNNRVQQCMDEFQQRVESGTGAGTTPG